MPQRAPARRHALERAVEPHPAVVAGKGPGLEVEMNRTRHPARRAYRVPGEGSSDARRRASRAVPSANASGAGSRLRTIQPSPGRS